MCSEWQTFGRLGHRGDHVVGEVARVRAGEAHPLQPVDAAAGPQQLAERVPVAELDAVRVDVLAEQGDLQDALGHQRLDLGQDLPRPAVLLPAAQRRHDAERAGVVAAHRDRHPAGVASTPAGPAASTGTPPAPRGSPPRRPRCAGPAPAAPAGSRCCGYRTRRRPRAPAGRSRRGPSGPGSRRPRSACRGGAFLTGREVAEVAVEAVVGVLPDRAGVEHDDVGAADPAAART